MQVRGRRTALIPLIIALIVLVALVAIPALAADPSPSPAASAPAAGKTEKPGKGPKDAKEKTPEVAVTLTGTVGTTTDADGDAAYTLTVGSTVYTLEAGPPWYWKDKHPLKPYVGKSVTIVGEQEQGTSDVDVQSVDGTVIREPGKPPWAGGWMRVGKDHPGWSQEKADRMADKAARFGLDCWPPGHCKDASGKPKTPAAAPTPTPSP
jgi:hypothetical protein